MAERCSTSEVSKSIPRGKIGFDSDVNRHILAVRNGIEVKGLVPQRDCTSMVGGQSSPENSSRM